MGSIWVDLATWTYRQVIVPRVISGSSCVAQADLSSLLGCFGQVEKIKMFNGQVGWTRHCGVPARMEWVSLEKFRLQQSLEAF